MRTDDNGDFWHIAVGGLLGGLIGGIAQVASNIIEGENAFDGVGAAFISGAASGALASTGVSYFIFLHFGSLDTISGVLKCICSIKVHIKSIRKEKALKNGFFIVGILK